jgi:hypothetical protein
MKMKLLNKELTSTVALQGPEDMSAAVLILCETYLSVREKRSLTVPENKYSSVGNM